jgi:hypothetical protein
MTVCGCPISLLFLHIYIFHIDHFRLHVTDDWTLILPPSEDLIRSCVVGLGCIESSFLCQTTPCITDFSDEHLAPVLVFIQYLTQPEVGKLFCCLEYSPHKRLKIIPVNRSTCSEIPHRIKYNVLYLSKYEAHISCSYK